MTRRTLSACLLPAVPALALLVGCGQTGPPAREAAAARPAERSTTPPLRFARGPQLFATPQRFGPMRVLGALPFTSSRLAYQAEPERLFSVTRSGLLAWEVLVLDAADGAVRARVLLSPLLDLHEVHDWERLCKRLGEEDSAWARSIRARLSPETLRSAEEGADAARAAVLRELNEVIGGPSLVSAGETMKPAARVLAGEALTPADLPWFNRMVVSDALAPAIAGVADPQGRIVVDLDSRRLLIEGPSRIWVLDLPTLKQSASLPLPDISPRNVGIISHFCPRTLRPARSYALDGDLRRLSIFDPATGDRVGDVPLTPPDQPYAAGGGLGTDEERGRIYVSQGTARTGVTVIDAATHRRLAYLPIGTPPGEVAVDPRTERVFVSGCHDFGVRVLDERTGRRIAYFRFDDVPWQLVAAPASRRLYVRLQCGLVVLLAEE